MIRPVNDQRKGPNAAKGILGLLLHFDQERPPLAPAHLIFELAVAKNDQAAVRFGARFIMLTTMLSIRATAVVALSHGWAGVAGL